VKGGGHRNLVRLTGLQTRTRRKARIPRAKLPHPDPKPAGTAFGNTALNVRAGYGATRGFGVLAKTAPHGTKGFFRTTDKRRVKRNNFSLDRLRGARGGVGLSERAGLYRNQAGFSRMPEGLSTGDVERVRTGQIRVGGFDHGTRMFHQTKHVTPGFGPFSASLPTEQRAVAG